MLWCDGVRLKWKMGFLERGLGDNLINWVISEIYGAFILTITEIFYLRIYCHFSVDTCTCIFSVDT